MRKNSRRTVAWALPLIALLVGCREEDNSELVIAAVAPTTGQYAEMGEDLLAGIRMAVAEKNASGGIDGRQIRLLVEDDKASPTDAVTVANRLVGNPSVLGIVGHMNSGTMLAASSVYAAAGVPVVMPVPTNPEITAQGYSNLFRVPITDDRQGPAIATFIVENLQKTALAVVHNKETYGQGIANEVRREFERRGFHAVAFEGVNADDPDFRALITSLRGLAPDAVFFGGGYSEAALFIRQMRELGVTVPVIMGDGSFDSQLMELAGPASEGCYVSNIAPTSAATPEAQAFFDAFLEEHGKIVAFAPLGYVAAGILMDALEKAPRKSRADILGVLGGEGYRFQSILGEFSFQPNGDSRGQRIFMHEIRGGKFEAVSF